MYSMFGSILSIDTFVFRFSPPLCHVMKTPDNEQRPPCLSHNSSSCSGVISNSIPSSFSLEYFKWFHKFFKYLYGLEDLVILRSAKTHCRQCSLCFSKSAFGKDFLHRSHILFAIIFSENFFYKKTIPYHVLILSPPLRLGPRHPDPVFSLGTLFPCLGTLYRFPLSVDTVTGASLRRGVATQEHSAPTCRRFVFHSLRSWFNGPVTSNQ
jgi:hypothetical protein